MKMGRPKKEYYKQHLFLSEESMTILNKCSDILDAQGYSEVIRFALRNMVNNRGTIRYYLNHPSCNGTNMNLSHNKHKIHITLSEKSKKHLDFCIRFFEIKSPSVLIDIALRDFEWCLCDNKTGWLQDNVYS